MADRKANRRRDTTRALGLGAGLAAGLLAAGLALAGAIPSGGPPPGTGPAVDPPAPGPASEPSFVLLAVHYLENGRPFGTADYGLRSALSFCQTQRQALLDRWLAEGGSARGADAVFIPAQRTIQRLLCVPEAEFDQPEFRLTVMKTPLPPTRR